MSRKPAERRPRKLRLQTLETRQLLAADAGEAHNIELPEDVNGDGQVTATDALLVMNAMRGSQLEAEHGRVMFRDVNHDGRLTSVDALRVMNRIARDRVLGQDTDRPPKLGRPHGDGNQPGQELRSIDGTGNHLDDPLLGSAGTPFRRLVDADYADGVLVPSGTNRASARLISNIVSAQQESIPNERKLSDLVWQWGQFIDHDITLSEGGTSEKFNIAVPAGDAYFDPLGTGTAEIELTRSAVAEGTGIDSPRQQINGITAFIDGSMIYGSDDDTAASLRSYEGGRLLTSAGDLLPLDESGFFRAGDVRANEQNGLTAMHTLWVREHNRVAEEIAANRPEWADEEIYQQARAYVIGEIQAITFNEYLPALLGRNAMERYRGYDSQVDPSISNLFATAAFRYGHTSLSSELKRLDDDGNVIEAGNLSLRDAFFNPSGVIEFGIDPLLKGLASNIAQEIDTQLVDDVRNFLFGPPGAGGFDLVALNIQRGRDHGLPDYNSVREQLGLPRAETFRDVSSDPDVQAKLATAYDSVDDIDVWVGALAEDHVPSASVGELIRTVLVQQFTVLRDGDRFWYQHTFDGQQLRNLEQTRLSDVIERNTDLTSIQRNAFFVTAAAHQHAGGPRRADDPPLSGVLQDHLDDGDGGPRRADDPPPPLSAGGLANGASAGGGGAGPRRADQPAGSARAAQSSAQSSRARDDYSAIALGEGLVGAGVNLTAVDQVLRSFRARP